RGEGLRMGDADHIATRAEPTQGADSRLLFAGDWRDRLRVVVEAMREMSLESDPQALVSNYLNRTRELTPVDGMVSLSRRNIEAPKYRVTRSSTWEEPINPWREPHRLPVFEGGLLGDLIYGEDPKIVDEVRVAPDDPAREYLEG